MAEIGIMIEGQEGLNWDRWRRICADVDRLGFSTLRRSDHLFSVMGRYERDCIDCWTSLALAAEWTSRVQIGPMVTPMPFKHPAILAREAATVDVLSGGRLLLGLGAGWHQAEYDAFGLHLPETQSERFAALEAGIDRIKKTWSMSNPKPVRGEVPLLLGGKGLKRTIPLAGRFASEWNMTSAEIETFATASRALDQAARDAGRRPEDIRRSIMATACVGRTPDEVRERANGLKEFIPRLNDTPVDDIIRALPFAGTADEVAAAMQSWIDAGVQLFVFQHFLLDDADHLAVLAEVLAPQVA